MEELEEAAVEVADLARAIAAGKVASYMIMAVSHEGEVRARVGIDDNVEIQKALVHRTAIGLRDSILAFEQGFRRLGFQGFCDTWGRLYGAALTLVHKRVSVIQPAAAADAKADP